MRISTRRRSCIRTSGRSPAHRMPSGLQVGVPLTACLFCILAITLHLHHVCPLPFVHTSQSCGSSTIGVPGHDS